MGRREVGGEFEQFVADTTDSLLRTAYLVAWDLPVAEDLVQECLFRVARRWPRVRTMEYPVAYARRILVNLALDGATGRTRHQPGGPFHQLLRVFQASSQLNQRFVGDRWCCGEAIQRKCPG